VGLFLGSENPVNQSPKNSYEIGMATGRLGRLRQELGQNRDRGGGGRGLAGLFMLTLKNRRAKEQSVPIH
jgi:hypothetical protein